jgi:multidrug efflux pump subunit AcrB
VNATERPPSRRRRWRQALTRQARRHAGAPGRRRDTIRDARAAALRRCDDRHRAGILVETSTQFGANTLDGHACARSAPRRARAGAEEIGVEYHPALLRPASFIESAIVKLRNSLLIGAVLVVALLLVMLRDWRGALVSFSAITAGAADAPSGCSMLSALASTR